MHTLNGSLFSTIKLKLSIPHDRLWVV